MSEEGKEAPPDRVTLRKWSAVALYAPVETLGGQALCAICRHELGDKCIECILTEDATLDTCVVLWGVCNHAFHAHCIGKFTKSQSKCPLHDVEWSVARTGR